MADDRTQKLAATNFWDELLKMRDEQREQRKNGIQVIRGATLPQEVNRQGLMRWYMHPAIKDTKPEPLAPGVPYRLFVQTGTQKAQHDFVPDPRTQ